MRACSFTLSALLAGITAIVALPSLAGEEGYICEIKQVRILADDGTMIENETTSEQFEERNFSINRRTGEMIGMPFTTSAFKTVSVLNFGSEDSSYKAMAQSQLEGRAAMYIYVAEHFEDREKPFWGTANGTHIYSGICE